MHKRRVEIDTMTNVGDCKLAELTAEALNADPRVAQIFAEYAVRQVPSRDAGRNPAPMQLNREDNMPDTNTDAAGNLTAEPAEVGDNAPEQPPPSPLSHEEAIVALVVQCNIAEVGINDIYNLLFGAQPDWTTYPPTSHVIDQIKGRLTEMLTPPG